MAIENINIEHLPAQTDFEKAVLRLQKKYPGKEITVIQGVPGVWIAETDDGLQTSSEAIVQS
jgi:hypothetical protein